MRKAVDQIEIDAGNPGATQAGRGSLRLLKTLHPVDGALDARIKALHAEAGAVDAA